METQTSIPTPEERFEKAFNFLFLPSANDPFHIPFILYPPDACEFRWSVWDADLHHTICYGKSALDAVETAIDIVNQRLQK